jgi:hypothetical protein
MDREQSGASVRAGSWGVRYTGFIRKCRGLENSGALLCDSR